jgi:uncharacterized protein YhaN
MQLVKAHINNFGKIHEQDFDFHEGLNSYIYENGWGKTTLSVFIKAMFYGMDYTSSKDVEKNEKLKYAPWQGGVYGGSLEFSSGGKAYRISRTFELKKNSDTFELRNLKTNKISADFTADIGTELFGVSRETYGRSVHVVLNESPAGSPDISAKLNNLIEAGDIGNYDKAHDILNKKAGSLKGKQKGKGLIPELQEKIDTDRDRIVIIQKKILQNEEYGKKITDISGEVQSLKAAHDELANQLSISAKYQSKLSYEGMKKDVEKAEKTKQELEEFFNGKIPGPDILKTIDTISGEYTTVTSNIKNSSITKSEKDQYEQLKSYFSGDIPEKAQIDSCLKTHSDYMQFKRSESEKKLSIPETQEFESLKQRYAGKDISAEKTGSYIKTITEVQEAKNEIIRLEGESRQKQDELTIAQLSKQKNTKRVIFFIGAALLLAAGAAAAVLLRNPAAGAAGIIPAVILAILGCISKTEKTDVSGIQAAISKLDADISSLKKKVEDKENGYKNFIASIYPDASPDAGTLNRISLEFSRYATLRSKSEEYSRWIKTQPLLSEEYENTLKTFVKRYCRTEDISSVPQEIQTLNEKLSRLHELEKKIDSDFANGKLQKEKKDKLESILSQYRTEKTLSFADQVQQIHGKLNDIDFAEKTLRERIQITADFEKEHSNDIASFSSLVKPEKSTDQLKAEMAALENQITEKNSTISGYQKQIDDNLAETEKKDSIETEMDRLAAEKQEKTTEHAILTKTINLLEKAKEYLDANYSDPMKDGFSRYMKMLGGKIDLIIDTDLKVAVDENGKTHESEFLSDGYKDMVNFCSRMALIDALFKDVTPPVILDDPFVNLDDDKVPRALNLVKKMANGKQILYFACHKSREIKQ